MCAVMVLALGIILASVPSNLHFTSVFSILLESGYPFVGALFVSRTSVGNKMARLQKGVFNPAAFLYTVKKRSMVDFVLLSVIREGLSVEGQLCHLEGIFM
jgi:hypothetical protein